jgi:two-component system, LytTR family, sensor kinase
MVSRAAIWGVLIGVWVAIGGLLTLELYLSLAPSDPTVSLGSVALGQFMRVSLWAALTPVVFWLQRVYPVDLRTWFWAVPLHFGVSVLAMVAIYLVRLAVVFGLYGEDVGTFWSEALDQFYGRNLIDIPIYWSVFGAGFTIALSRRYRETQVRTIQLEKDLARAEVAALKAQLQPHFLFNTLNTISVLVQERNNNQAVGLIAKLSQLLRLALETTGQQETTLQHELDFLRRYLEIQQVRFSDRLEVRFKIDPATLDALVPNLMLQPLVENAVLHGFAPKPDRGCIEVASFVRDDRLHLVVRDDGPGFPPEGGELHEGIGLSNTRNRLRWMFGDDASFDLRNRPQGGAEVELVMPLRPRTVGAPPPVSVLPVPVQGPPSPVPRPATVR